MSIPLVNYNHKYEFIDPTLSEEEYEIINKLAKLSRRNIDQILCAKSNQIKLSSTAKLAKCLKTHNAAIFFCSERLITNFRHDSKRCSKLPETIVIQLSPHKILLKTDGLKWLDITCNDATTRVPIKETYSIIELNPNCRVSSEDFKIDEVRDNITMSLNAEPFRISHFKLDAPSYVDFKDMKENHVQMKKITNDLLQAQKTLESDIMDNTRIDSINQNRVKDIQKQEYTTSYFKWSFGSITTGIVTLGTLSLIFMCFRKFRPKENRTGMDIVIKGPKIQSKKKNKRKDPKRDIKKRSSGEESNSEDNQEEGSGTAE